jgi:hypothetical protein
MKSIGLMAVSLLLLMTSVARQVPQSQINSSAPEYGTLSDIKDKRRVYVYSDDLESRELILKEVSKDSLLEVVGKVEEGDFFIFYGRSFFETGYTSFGGIFGGVFGSVTSKTSAEIGEYYVVMRGDKLETGAFRPRILWGKQNLNVARNSPASIFVKKSTRLPAMGVTKQFIKELQKARQNKK